jgi:hypothetical protein
MLLQAVIDSSSYKTGQAIGGWIPFILLAIGLTIMILQLRKKNRREQQP